ncbi:MAG: hypothetical protein U1E65_02405 [Myxococcota bacterium]
MGTISGNTAVRAYESKALASGGVIDASEAKELVKLAKAKGEDVQNIRQMLASDSFEPAARKIVENGLGIRNAPAPSIAGAKVGDATVTRTLGDPSGYADRYQAYAAARMSGADNAAVIMDKSGKWRAVQLDKQIPTEARTPSADVPWAAGLVPEDPKKIEALRGKIQGLLDRQREGERIDGAELGSLRKQLASQVFGVPESEINIMRSSNDRKAGFLNLNTALASDAEARGRLGPERSPDGAFNPRKDPAVEIDASEIEGSYKRGKGWSNTPVDSSRAVFFHEATHEAVYMTTQKYVAEWEAKGNHFTESGGEDLGFRNWMMNRKDVDWATRLTVINTASSNFADTETRAHFGAFRAAIAAGSPEAAKDQLMTFARYKASAPQQVTDAELAECERLYKTLPKDMQKAFDDAFAAAKAVNPHWNGASFRHGR